MADWVVPIGQPLGVDPQTGRFLLRAGRRVHELDELELLAWGALAGILDDPPQWLSIELARTRVADLHVELAAALGPAPDDDYVAQLCSRHLAARVSDDDLGIRQFLAAHRFQPNLVGLWASPSEDARRFVGFDDDAVLALPGPAYEVYVEASAHASVQDSCVAIAMRSGRAPDEVADRVAALRTAFMATARVIVAIGGGYFDRAAA